MKKSEATRERILDSALQLLRKQGFEKTTMRDIAESAGLALGAAYYYFPSKEAILFAYYDRTQVEHEARASQAMAAAEGLRERLGLLMHQKLASVRRERKLLGAIVQRLANPTDPVSAFAEETRSVRERSMALFAEALDGEPIPGEIKRLVAPVLWLLQLGFLLCFVHDKSARQTKTQRLVDDTLDFVVPLIYLGASPQVRPLVAQLARTLERAGLIHKI